MLEDVYEEIIRESVVGTPSLASAQARLIEDGFSNLMETLVQTRDLLSLSIQEFGQVLSETLRRGNKIMVCGNGGSAADAQHFAAELTGRFQLPNRKALPILPLNVDPVLITAWSNDVSYDKVFSRQVEAYGQPGDALIMISTSGKSKNLLEAYRAARRMGITCLGLLGKDGGSLAAMVDRAIVIPGIDTARIQEVHMLILHLACEMIELDLFTEPVVRKPALSVTENAPLSTVDFLIPLETGKTNGGTKQQVPKYAGSKKNTELGSNENLGWKSNTGNRRSAGIG